MSQTKYLVPIDFSPHSEAAVEFASAFAKDSNAELLIVHVVDPDVEQLEGTTPESAMDGLVAALHDVQPLDDSIPFAHRLLHGVPAEAIISLATEESVELIVMGTHGRTGLKRVVMGSVAEAVVRRAPCPVMTVKQPMQAALAK